MTYQDEISIVASAPFPWEKLKGCNILVTGATGLIGTCIIDVLMSHAGKDYHVYASGRDEKRAMVRFADYCSDPAFHFFHYDVMEPLEGDIDFHYVIHAASNASPNFFASNPVEVMKSNLYGVCNLLDYGMRHALKRLLYVSTGEVYGEGDGRIFTEEYSGFVDCVKPRSCYPSSKRASETLCAAYSAEYGVDVVIARPSHTYGPKFTAQDNRVYAQFIRNVIHGEDIVMKSTGSQFRSWCYVVDCVSALLFVLFYGESGNAYNIADEASNISIRELAEMIASIAGRKVVVELASEQERKGYNVVQKSVFSTEKLRALGWSVSGTMYEKMESTIREVRQSFS